MSLFVRIFCFYLIIILIALQSVNAISAMNNRHQQSHQYGHQNTHQKTGSSANLSAEVSINSPYNQPDITNQYPSKHQDSDHHSEAELLAFQAQALAGELEHSDADHPDCHANHCHHSHLIYLDLPSQIYLSKAADKKVIKQNVLFNSLLISPISRPPIV